MKSATCRALQENWVEKCVNVLNSTSSTTCSDECKNATHELFKDPQGYKLRDCDCGHYDNELFVGPKNPEDMAKISKCFTHQSIMRKICGFDYADQCQKCQTKKGKYTCMYLTSYSNLTM